MVVSRMRSATLLLISGSTDCCSEAQSVPTTFRQLSLWARAGTVLNTAAARRIMIAGFSHFLIQFSSLRCSFLIGSTALHRSRGSVPSSNHCPCSRDRQLSHRSPVACLDGRVDVAHGVLRALPGHRLHATGSPGQAPSGPGSD